MELKKNPVFKLAFDVAQGIRSREEAFALAQSPGFFGKLAKKHFVEVIRTIFSDSFLPDPDPLPDDLIPLALECAQAKGLGGEVWGMLHAVRAQVALQKSDLQTALHYSQLAKKLVRRNGSRIAVSICETTEICALAMSGNIEGFSRIQKLLHQRPIGGGESSLAHSHIHLAHALSVLGEYERAIEFYHMARTLFLRIKERTAHFSILSRKKPRGADAELQKSQQKYSIQICVCDLSIATSLLFMGKYDAAVARLAVCKKSAKKLGALAIVARCDVQHAVALRSWGDWEKAIEILEQSGDLRRSIGPAEAFQAEIQLAYLYCDTERYESAISLLEAMKKSAFSDGALDRVADSDRVLAKVYKNLGDVEMARDLLHKAREIYQAKEIDLDVTCCDIDLAWIRAHSGEYTEALNTFRALKSRFAGNIAMALSYQCQYGAGYVLWKMGQYEEARKEYDAVISVIERFRQGASQGDLRESLLEARRSVYLEAIQLCLDQGDCSGALEFVEKLKSRNLAEMLEGRTLLPQNASTTEMEEFRKLSIRLRVAAHRLNEARKAVMPEGLSDDYWQARKEYEDQVRRIRQKNPWFDPEQTLPWSASDAKSLISDPSTALVELFPMSDKTVVFVVLHQRPVDETTVIIRDYTETDVADDLKAVRDKAQITEALRKLYDRLLVPIKPYLTEVNKIIFVPYSGLHLLPLHAMFTEENGVRKYLVDDFMVTYAPSAKVLRQCLGMDKRARDRGFVASADPKGDLPYSPHEAQAVARHFGAEVNRRSTRQEFISRGREAQIVHYTGHADGNALILHADKTSRQTDLYDVGDIFVSLDMPESSLVTLSACETGKVRLSKTDEYIGLPSAFLHAGAATVICSLWRVSDLSTTLLMGKMYELMDEGLGKAESLRAAQRWLKDPAKREEHLAEIRKFAPKAVTSKGGVADSRRFRRTRGKVEAILPQDLHNPYYWGGFICTGAP